MKELTTAEQKALCEFAKIDMIKKVDGDRVLTMHLNPIVTMSLSNYLNTAEGALRVLAAMAKSTGGVAVVLDSTNDMAITIHDLTVDDFGDDALGDTIGGLGIHLNKTILTAALELPVVRELVAKYEAQP